MVSPARGRTVYVIERCVDDVTWDVAGVAATLAAAQAYAQAEDDRERADLTLGPTPLTWQQRREPGTDAPSWVAALASWVVTRHDVISE